MEEWSWEERMLMRTIEWAGRELWGMVGMVDSLMMRKMRPMEELSGGEKGKTRSEGTSFLVHRTILPVHDRVLEIHGEETAKLMLMMMTVSWKEGKSRSVGWKLKERMKGRGRGTGEGSRIDLRVWIQVEHCVELHFSVFVRGSWGWAQEAVSGHEAGEEKAKREGEGRKERSALRVLFRILRCSSTTGVDPSRRNQKDLITHSAKSRYLVC